MNDAPASDARDCRCLCGAVRFSLPQPLREVGMCHCGMCRRWAGAPLNGGISAAVTMRAGDALRWYAASPWGERGFCARCGSSLFWRQKGSRANWMVCAGSLPSTDGLRLVQHIYMDDKPAYYDMAGDARRLTGDAFTDETVAAMPTPQRWFVKTAVTLTRLKNRLSPPAPPPPGADKRGRCLCGAVRFRLPRAPQNAWMCHCGQCRRWGAGVGILGITTGVEAMEASDTLRWHKTSAERERGFCGTCGASLFWRSLETGDITSVCAGALEDDRGLQLQEHLYTEDKPGYYDMA